MALEGGSDNSQDKARIFTGLENFRIVAINPDLQKAKALGYNYEKEPEYTGTTDDGNKRVMISFFLDNFPEEGEPHIQLPLTYFLEETDVVSSTNKVQYTNKKGEFAYLEDLDDIPSNMDWFDLDGVRPAVKGEEMLVKMLRNFANIKRDGACSIENPSALFVGNVSEIKEMVSAFIENKIGVLLVVKKVNKKDDNGQPIEGDFNYYQGVYTRKTERPYSNDYSYLNTDITQWQENGGGSKMIIPNPPYALKEWEGINPDPQPSGAPAGNNNW